MSAPSQRLVEANGVRLHCLEWGEQGAPPVVLLHATGFLARLWQPVAEALARRFHVYAYDARGHGDSDKPEGDGAYHWQRLVDDLQGFLDRLSLRGPEGRGVPLVGHSSGGAAAAYLAATRPEYVSGLALIEPIIIPGGLAEIEEGRPDMAAAARRRRQVFENADEMLEAYRARPAFARWQPEVLRLYAEEGTFRRGDGRVQLKCPAEVEALLFENSSSLPIWAELPRVAGPTLVMYGGETNEVLRTIAEGAAARIPGARTEVIGDAGHLAPMEQADAVATRLLEFLREGPW